MHCGPGLSISLGRHSARTDVNYQQNGRSPSESAIRNGADVNLQGINTPAPPAVTQGTPLQAAIASTSLRLRPEGESLL